MPRRSLNAEKPPRIPPYCLHRASGRAYLKTGGKMVYLGDYGSEASRIAYAAAVADVLAGRAVVAPKRRDASLPGCLTVREVCARYVAFASGYYRKRGKPTSEVAIIVRACDHAAALMGDLPADEFGPLALKSVRERIVESGVARTTVNKYIDRIRRAFTWAAGEELIPASVPAALATVGGLRTGRTTARETDPVLSVPDDVVEATLSHLPAVVADMVRLQRATGMRPGEVCDLRPCDLDRTGEVWTYRPASHKTTHHNKMRVVQLAATAQAILLRYLARHPRAYCFRPCDSEAKRRADAATMRTTPLSCGDSRGTNRVASPLRAAGDRYTTDSYRRAITRAAVKAGVATWAPNQIRHSFATMVSHNHGREAARVLLSHSKVSTTDVYIERDLNLAAKVAQAIG